MPFLYFSNVELSVIVRIAGGIQIKVVLQLPELFDDFSSGFSNSLT